MKIGSAHVKGLYTVPNGSGTQLADGCDAIWNLGLRTIKLYCTPGYATDYPLQTAWSAVPTTCTELAQTTQMATQLARGWDTVFLTTFSFANGLTNWWRPDIAVSKLQAEYTEIYNLAVHLLTTYAGTNRTFVLQNWEGDWAYMDSFTPSTAVDVKMTDRYAAFLAWRQRAVEDARRDTAVTGVRVLHAIELNRVVDRHIYRHRIINDIAGRVKPDVISYSAYDSSIVSYGWGTDYADWAANTLPLYRKSLQEIRAAFPDSILVVGEIGFPENEAANEQPNADVGRMITSLMAVSDEEGASYFLYWQVFDNEPHGTYTYRGYWLQKPNGDPTLASGALTA